MAGNDAQAGRRTFMPKQESAAPRKSGHDPLDDLVGLLRQSGYTVIAPSIVDDVVMLRPIESAAQLPRGLGDQQEPGHYRTAPGEPEMYFEYAVGPDSPKRYFFPPVQRLFVLKPGADTFEMADGPPPPPKLAFLGLRPCEIEALRVQDQVFGLGVQEFRCETDPFYSTARKESFVVAVNCMRPGGTCFCASMGVGPQATDGFDLALTELRHGFIIVAGTERGAEILARLPVRDPSPAELELADLKMELARKQMGRQMNSSGLVELLERGVDDPLWDRMATRCLACGNCTMVCPTCFCSTVVDSNDLSGETTRIRYWESCYTHQFSYTTAGPARSSIRGRHRHWVRHKLCTWWEQFGSSGCVGCGRCITWCPVGIDITAEIAELPPGADPPAKRPRIPPVKREALL